MKYIDAEKLKAEIERYEAGAQSAYNPHDEYADFFYGKVIACEDLLSILDTLPEEPGVDVTDFCKPIDPGIAQCVADHWWEMLDGKEPDKVLSEEPDKSLEEAAKEYATTHFRNNEFPTADSAFIAGAKWQAEQDKETIELAEDHAFLAGANWQKEQMLKGAVEGVITCHNLNRYILVPNLDDSLTYGEKVRIIVLKAEEE